MTKAILQEKIAKQNKTKIHNAICNSIGGFLKEGIFRCMPDLKFIYANETLIKMFGYTSLQELVMVSGDVLYVEEECRLYLMNKMSEAGIVIDYPILCRKRDGCNFWGLITFKRTIINGITFYEGRMHNISNQVKIEEQLKESQIRLEKVSIELDRFIYSASHDIRSPIASIMGIVNLMRMDAKGQKEAKYIGMMDASLAKMEYFIQELTSHAKNSIKSIGDERIDFDVMLRNLLNEFKEHHPFYGLVKWNVEVDSSHAFYSDPARLSRILNNIIKNSLDYSDQQKSSKVISIRIEIATNHALIEILDNGIGISPMHLENVFDMFYRGTHFSKGPGLGLYTVRETLTKLGGSVTLNSEYGVGTSIKIVVPNSRKGKLINKKNALRSSIQKRGNN